jgi:hypothetical protein
MYLLDTIIKAQSLETSQELGTSFIKDCWAQVRFQADAHSHLMLQYSEEPSILILSRFPQFVKKVEIL